MSTSESAIASLAVGFQGQEDSERHGLRAALEVAGEGDGGAELAEGPSPAEHSASDDGRRRVGDCYPPEDHPAACPERGGSVLVTDIGAAQT